MACVMTELLFFPFRDDVDDSPANPNVVFECDLYTEDLYEARPVC